MQITYTRTEVERMLAKHIRDKFDDVVVNSVTLNDDGTVFTEISDRVNPKLAVPVPNQKMTR